MAINSNGALEDNKNSSKSRCSSKSSNLSSCRLININFDSCSSKKALNRDIKSPYFTNDKVQMLNKVSEKKAENRKPVEIFSSFPLAASVYKANSDEFKLKKKKGKKIKKSVLTLPNEPAPMPKTYTVSDLNDSEGFNVGNDSRVNKPKKRRCMKRFKKGRIKEHSMQYYDRDARYCSQLNIDLDCSSSEVVNFTGDGNRVSELNYKSNNYGNDDVWAVLRNINKFQFIPSSASQESVVPLRKRRPIDKKNNHRNDTHFIETCHTEEFSYISSYEVDSKTHESCSPSSSFDRVTVIDKNSEQSEIMKQLGKNIFGSNFKLKDKLKSAISSPLQQKNKLKLKNCNKKGSHVKKKSEDKQNVGNSTEEKVPLEERGNELTCATLLSPERCKPLHLLKPKEFKVYSDNIITENDNLSNGLLNNLQLTEQFVDHKKLNNTKSLAKSRNVKVNTMNHIGAPEKQLSEISEVILNKGLENDTSKFSEPQRRPRLAVTLPNTNVTKLSQLEIKRRLANQKFPIIILGKDQLTNQGIFVSKDDPPQFHGLDNHMWPFMLEWSEQKRDVNVQNNLNKETIKTKHLKDKRKISYNSEVTSKIDNKEDFHNSHAVNKKAESLKKNKMNTIKTISYPTTFLKETPPQLDQRPKPLYLLNNKMLQILQKNPTDNFGNDRSNKQLEESIGKHKRVGTNDIIKNLNNPNRNIPNTLSVKDIRDKPVVDNRIVKKSYLSLQHPWAKGKWASDFIENIIKKIKSGVYYGVDRSDMKYRINGTEVSTQTDGYALKNAFCQNSDEINLPSNLTFAKDDALKNIPGFDTSFTTLEIETITSNTIAVKHCISNVVVQFDIQHTATNDPKNVIQSKKSISCIPINLKDNQEKVFKCNTSIINAFLPAELCSIIPAMMQSILNGENNLESQPANINPNFIVKSTEIESIQKMLNSILKGGMMSVKIKSILNGGLLDGYSNKSISNKSFLAKKTKDLSFTLGEENITKKILYQFNQPTLILHLSNYNTDIDKTNIITNETSNSCMALVVYEPKIHSVIPYRGPFRIIDFMKKIVDKEKQNRFNKITTIFNDLYHNKKFKTGGPLPLRCENRTILCLPPRVNVGIISLFNAIEKNNQCLCLDDNNDNTPFISLESVSGKQDAVLTAPDKSRNALQRKPQPAKILRKKGYVKCYRKCKSMSSISSVKSTPLSRVTNLEEFCQVLGSNSFSTVLDGCLEKKLLGAVEEMKNWITDISPKQALLVLLLSNKKDTPNLIRFRPVLLQGIAVNRITKAVELDTEIEVIETERFYKMTQCEGISYLPASTRNQDSLLEELYWIAKTTASDYQKTFDESSEQLLKSLLAKRKKLNPSYLRVMARYVGLGLLAQRK